MLTFKYLLKLVCRVFCAWENFRRYVDGEHALGSNVAHTHIRCCIVAINFGDLLCYEDGNWSVFVVVVDE